MGRVFGIVELSGVGRWTSHLVPCYSHSRDTKINSELLVGRVSYPALRLETSPGTYTSSNLKTGVP